LFAFTLLIYIFFGLIPFIIFLFSKNNIWFRITCSFSTYFSLIFSFIYLCTGFYKVHFANDIDNTGGGYIIIGVEEKNGTPHYPLEGVNQSEIDNISILDIIEVSKSDKKMIGDKVKFIYLKELGNADISTEFTSKDFESALKEIVKD
ncbi:MAG: hypothetical protein HUJ71_00400, partial [Pseudobutyrivibrio sp.]|nr:hypothetical protein [Pseudobutyrivibrio sp.]